MQSAFWYQLSILEEIVDWSTSFSWINFQYFSGFKSATKINSSENHKWSELEKRAFCCFLGEGSFNMRPARWSFHWLLEWLPKLFDWLTNTLWSRQSSQKQYFFDDRASCDATLTALPIIFTHLIVLHTKQNNRVVKYCASTREDTDRQIELNFSFKCKRLRGISSMSMSSGATKLWGGQKWTKQVGDFEVFVTCRNN